MPVTGKDILTVRLNKAEVLYCMALANARHKGQSVLAEAVDTVMAYELSLYALSRELFGLTDTYWCRHLPTSARPGQSAMADNIIVSAFKAEAKKKLSSYPYVAAGPTRAVYVFAVAQFEWDTDDAVVTLMGWTRGHTDLSKIKVGDMNPLPPFCWEQHMEDNHDTHKDGTTGGAAT